ncbi:hypothetical protein OH77DRAFT_951256 [Trametes cingulata]|nr:hypothetical protein OH77DRAFT_951256 [Trametes cingulata]
MFVGVRRHLTPAEADRSRRTTSHMTTIRTNGPRLSSCVCCGDVHLSPHHCASVAPQDRRRIPVRRFACSPQRLREGAQRIGRSKLKCDVVCLHCFDLTRRFRPGEIGSSGRSRCNLTTSPSLIDVSDSTLHPIALDLLILPSSAGHTWR